MLAPRRRLVRSPPTPASPSPKSQLRLQKLRTRLEHERAALARWQKRLKRAFNAVEKCQRTIARLERQIAITEE